MKLLDRTILDDFEMIYGDEECDKANFVLKVNKALNFASKHHKNQKRDVTGEPYIHHLIRVFNMLLPLTADEDILIASLLHDVIEDTKVNFEDLYYLFGEKVAILVQECSKPYGELKSKEALVIKLADLLDNALDNPTDKWIKNKCDMIKICKRCS